MAENMMCPDHKANNENFRGNYDEIFRKDKKDERKTGKDKDKD